MFVQKNYSNAVALIVLSLSSGLSVAASSWSTMLIEAGKKVIGTTLGKAALAASAGAIAGYAIQKYRTSRPVAPPALYAYAGVPVEQKGVATLFVHGFGGNAEHARVYQGILPGTIYTFDFPDADDLPISLAHTGLGQPVEVDHLEYALRELGDREDIEKIIVFGISRGGATVANLLKRAYIPHREKIAGFIIEQSFARVSDILDDKLRALGLEGIPGSMAAAEIVVTSMCNQYSSANQPADNAHTAMSDMKKKPILITCSQEDQLIPHTSTEALSQAFYDAGFLNTHHVTFQHGQHVGLPFGESHHEYRSRMGTFIELALR